VKFQQLLAALNAKGRIDEAQHYEKEVFSRFQGLIELGVYSREEVLQLQTDVVIAMLEEMGRLYAEYAPVFAQFTPKLMSPLQAYIAEKQAEGFTVYVAEKYRHA
jgi:hypothetical protein